MSALRWEDNTHLLLVVAGPDPGRHRQRGEIQPLEALVRCDVHTVTCELATTPRRTTPVDTAAYGLIGAPQQ